MSKSPERYSLDKAREEASRMQEKIKSGEARTYGEAEKLIEIETEQSLSVEDIKKYAEALKVKIEVAKAQREKDIEQKLIDREVLIKEAEKNDQLLREAQEVLEYFIAMRDLGELKDPANVQKLEEIRTLVSSLEKRQAEINERIRAIENRSEIVEKLYDAAKKEDIERAADKEFKKAYEQLIPQVDRLAESIKSLAERKCFLWQEHEKYDREFAADWQKIGDLFNRAKEMLGKSSNFIYTLNEVWYKARDPEEIKRRLSEVRRGLGILGIFKGKEKAAIDFILSKAQDFEECNRALSNLFALKQQIEATKAEEADLAEQFKAILLNAWEAQNKINELTGQPHHTNTLPLKLKYRLEGRMMGFADLKCFRDGREVGKYKGWHDANRQDFKNSVLYDIWKRTEKAVEGLALRGPKKTEEQK